VTPTRGSIARTDGNETRRRVRLTATARRTLRRSGSSDNFQDFPF
jgi:hypothetical protein